MWIYNDGGREAAGFQGKASGDCVCRAIAIATQKPYLEVYNALNNLKDSLRQTKRVKGSHSRTGVNRIIYQRYLASLGWKWVAVSGIGTGCKMHLKSEELPKGRIITRLSRHLCAVVDGTIHDIYNPDRGGTRCVYGYFIKK